MTTVVSKGSHPIPLSTLGLSEMSAPARRMVKTKRRVLIDYARAKDDGLRKLVRERQLRYGFTVPVLARGHLLASITVDAPGEHKAFSGREVDLIQAVADQAAAAIENALLTEGLRKSEEGARFLAEVVETADVAFAVREPDGRLVLFNRAFVELVGYSRSELDEGAATLAVGLTPLDWWEVEEPLLAEAVATRRPVRYEKEYLRKDGSRVPVEVFAQPVFDEAGELREYHSFITDISERKRAEEALQASEAKYRTLFGNMAEEVHFWRLVRDEVGEIVTWRLVSANPPALKTWGFGSLDEIEGKTTDEIFGPGATEHYMPVVQRIVSEGRADSYEDYFSNLDKYFRFTSVPFGEYFITTGADITAVKKSEQAALDAEKRFRATFEQAAVGIGHRSIDGRWLRVNDRLCELLGYKREELLGLTLADVTHRDDLAADLAHIDDLLAGKATSYTMEKRYVRKDGRILWGALTASLVRDEAGEPDYFVAVVQDVSARRQAEEERQHLLERSQAQTEELQAQSEELRVQGEELQLRYDAELTQRAALLRENELRAGLNAIGEMVHSTLDSDEVMRRALGEAGRVLGIDCAAIELNEGGTWPMRYVEGLPPAALGSPLTGEPVIARLVASSREALVLDDSAQHDTVGPFARRYGIRSLVAVPLLARDEVLGVLLLVERKARRHFDPAEVDFAHRLGTMAGLALENARLFEDQRHIAQTLQENLIHELPAVAGLELGVVARTAHDPELVGGDFSDVFVVDDTHIVVLIGDVAGKGIKAAGITETVRAKVRAFATIDPSPAFILGKTNELMLKFDPDDPHVTAFCCVLDPHSGHLSYASAGHPAPIHLGAYTCQALQVAFGPPLGSFERSYAGAHHTLTLGDYLVLYTDGVTEARHEGELLGEQRLLEIVSGLRGRSAQAVAEGVRDAALAWAGRLGDDLQVVVLRLS